MLSTKRLCHYFYDKKSLREHDIATYCFRSSASIYPKRKGSSPTREGTMITDTAENSSLPVTGLSGFVGFYRVLLGFNGF